MNFLEALKTVDNFTVTENGANALLSTHDYVLDAFGTLGNFVNIKKEAGFTGSSFILDTFYKAFAQDKKLALKYLFYLRDVRGGQGCRTVFKIIIRSLANSYPQYVLNNLDNILFFGRGDDYLVLLDTPIEKEVIKYLKEVLMEDLSSVRAGGKCSLLAKWLPSENASSKTTKYYANKLIKGFKFKPAEYRKILSELRANINIVETLMSQNKWEDIIFDNVPSKASMIYSDAFYRHVSDKYENYLENLIIGKSKVNAKALFPVNIVHEVLKNTYSPSRKDIVLNDALWKALPNYFEEAGLEETGICVVDTSGSMYGTPIEVAISLGLYCADKAKGPFKNHFITFSSRPKLQEIVGDNIYDKVNSICKANWNMNTNIEAVFNLILNTALTHKLNPEDLPNKIYIISDMQFDCASSVSKNKLETLFESIKRNYEEHGYVMPAIVYWNVSTYTTGIFQQTASDVQCCMVSGYTPSLFKSVLLGTEYEEVVNENGEKTTKIKLDPLTIMLKTLNDERYDRVWVG